MANECREQMKLIKPKSLFRGAKVGVFTPSTPAHHFLREKYLHGLSELRREGCEVIEGSLTARVQSQGYRSGSPKERVEEFNELIRNPEISL